MKGSSRGIWVALGLVAFASGATFHVHTSTVGAKAVPVRFAEGMVHGFLDLTTQAGAPLAHGDLLQVSRNDEMASRMVFHFDDGSVFEEAVTYAQQGVFTMLTYHLVQSGPAFDNDLDATMSRSGAYVIRTKTHKDGREHEYTGTLPMPADVYNGMIPTIAKNVSSRETTTVHVVAFMPEPRVIAVELAPSGLQRVRLGQHEETAVNFALKPQLGFFLHLAAKVTGKLPAESHIWIITDGVPAFVRSEGPLYSGPVWRIALTSPEWPR